MLHISARLVLRSARWIGFGDRLQFHSSVAEHMLRHFELRPRRETTSAGSKGGHSMFAPSVIDVRCLRGVVADRSRQSEHQVLKSWNLLITHTQETSQTAHLDISGEIRSKRKAVWCLSSTRLGPSLSRRSIDVELAGAH